MAYRHTRGRRMALAGATLTLATVYAVAAAPIPLLNLYRRQIGLGSGDLALTAVAYFAGTLLSLLVLARLSDYRGRRLLTACTLLSAIVSCLLFAMLGNVGMLMSGRFLQGIACGLASSCVAAYIIDSTPSDSALGMVITGSMPMLGLALGALGAGALAQYGGQPALIYGVLIAVSILCLLMTAGAAETVTLRKGALASLRPQFNLPDAARRLLPAAASTFIGTWSVGGFFQAFSASMAAEQLGSNNTLLAAVVFTGLMAPNVPGSMFAVRVDSRRAQRWGMSLFLLAVVALAASLHAGATLSFLLFSVLAGGAMGMAFSGALRGMLAHADAAGRAGVLSVVYLISYAGAAVPNLIVSRLAGRFGLAQIAAAYAVLVGLAWLVVMCFSGQPANERNM